MRLREAGKKRQRWMRIEAALMRERPSQAVVAEVAET